MTGEMFGPYRLVSLLGRGGMGEVWRAVDTRKDREVALKVLGSWLGGDAEFAHRFRRESALAAKLTGPNIVPIHDYGEVEGRLFLDMPLIDGTDLGVLLERDGPLPPGRAVRIAAQVAKALTVAHRAGLVHRDVKPSNILVDNDGGDHTWLIDFGIARALDGTKVTVSGAAVGVGTPAYMAPERFDGQADHRGDVYALGCVLHEALTGAPPFQAASLLGYMRAHDSTPPPRPSQLRAGVPGGFDAVVATALAKDPAARYPTAADLARAAQQVAHAAPPAGIRLGEPDGDPTVITPPSMGPPATGGPDSDPRVITLRPADLPDPGGGPGAGSAPLRRAGPGTLAVAGLVAATPPGPVAGGTPPPAVGPGAEPRAEPEAWPEAGSGAEPGAEPEAGPEAGSGAEPGAESGAEPEAGRTPPPPAGPPAVAGLVAATPPGPEAKPGGPQAAPRRRRGRSLLLAALAAVLAVGLVATAVTVLNRPSTTPITEQVLNRPSTTPITEQVLTGHFDIVRAVAAGQLDGRPVIISGSFDTTVRVWDLATGTPIGDPLTGHTDAVAAVATAQLDGRPVIVSGSDDGTVRVWDLATGTPIGDPLTGHTNGVFAVATAQLGGRPVIVSGSDDGTVRVWDLATGTPIGDPLTGHTDGVLAVATAQLDGRPVIVSGSVDGTVRVWDLATGNPIGAPTGHADGVFAVATGQLDGRPVIVSTSRDGTIRTWDLIARTTP